MSIRYDCRRVTGCRPSDRSETGGLSDRSPSHQFHRLTQRFDIHIVQKDHVDTELQNLLQLFEVIYLDLDLDKMADPSANPPHGLGR